MARKSGGSLEAVRIIFWVYLTLLTVLVVFKGFAGNISLGWNTDRVNLVPFHTIGVYFKLHSVEIYARNIWGNILPFIPFGILLPAAYPKMRRFWVTMLVAFAIILLFETLQLLTGLGSFDVDDIILNMASCAIGYFLYWVFVGRKR
ncbi:hypothetical protein FACS18949_00290 [Clostridia bacterium]|nr:hypothetical protein FACS189425_00460 [Clostridia bacterium]GHV31553.1 hypothetical protein FACS18949_00290 [Clostridia bacterium]